MARKLTAATIPPTPVVRRPRTVHRKPAAESTILPLENLEEHTPANTTSEDISRLAYSLWEERGCPAGTAEEDWLRAEQLLQSE